MYLCILSACVCFRVGVHRMHKRMKQVAELLLLRARAHTSVKCCNFNKNVDTKLNKSVYYSTWCSCIYTYTYLFVYLFPLSSK